MGHDTMLASILVEASFELGTTQQWNKFLQQALIAFVIVVPRITLVDSGVNVIFWSKKNIGKNFKQGLLPWSECGHPE